jgi:large repetitive protein
MACPGPGAYSGMLVAVQGQAQAVSPCVQDVVQFGLDAACKIIPYDQALQLALAVDQTAAPLPTAGGTPPPGTAGQLGTAGQPGTAGQTGTMSPGTPGQTGTVQGPTTGTPSGSPSSAGGNPVAHLPTDSAPGTAPSQTPSTSPGPSASGTPSTGSAPAGDTLDTLLGQLEMINSNYQDDQKTINTGFTEALTKIPATNAKGLQTVFTTYTKATADLVDAYTGAVANWATAVFHYVETQATPAGTNTSSPTPGSQPRTQTPGTQTPGTGSPSTTTPAQGMPSAQISDTPGTPAHDDAHQGQPTETGPGASGTPSTSADTAKDATAKETTAKETTPKDATIMRVENHTTPTTWQVIERTQVQSIPSTGTTLTGSPSGTQGTPAAPDTTSTP